ncbi:MAG TPA: hypothetical protein VND66_08270 [Acidobacteriaceae bacterium]|nr:hypothetical protein [Terriglobia bacterium]HVC90602.1 hypothetical protein [Acidobacteriaceae bacterium]
MPSSQTRRSMDLAASSERLKQAHPWQAVLILVVLAAMIGPGEAWAQPLRVLFGDSAHPVVSGEAWLIANRWGAYPGVLVATIQNGKLQPRLSVKFPQYWEQASDYKLLLAVADRPVGPPASVVEDFAYGTVGRPEYLKRFSTVYLSPPLPAKHLGKDWPAALERVGRFVNGDLVLPLPVRRTIRLLYPDGRPLADVQVPVLLFGSNGNHCGADVGILLGTFTTNREGEINVVAPRALLDLSTSYYEMEAGGAAGETFSLKPYLIIDGEPAITVKKLWTLPQHDYVVRLRTPENQPIAHAHLTACINFEGCGGCAPIRAPESDSSGTIRFSYDDLREMYRLTVVRADGKERDLTNSEMHDLLTTYHLNLRWD